MVRGYDFVKFGGYLGNICLYFHRSLVLDNVVPRFLTPLRKIGIFGFYQTMNNIWKLPANITDIFISSLYFILDLKPKLTSLLLRVFVSPFYLILPFVEAGGTTYVRPDGLSDVSLKVKRLFFVSFFTGLVFTGVLTPIISAFTGTLLPSNSAFSYLEDKYNIILYIVVCPAYIALGSIIVYCTVEFQKIPLIKNLINEPRPKFLHGKTGHVIWIALSFLLAIIVSANYQHDVFSLNNSFTNKDDIYWFFTEDRGRIYFNFAGYFLYIFKFFTSANYYNYRYFLLFFRIFFNLPVKQNQRWIVRRVRRSKERAKLFHIFLSGREVRFSRLYHQCLHLEYVTTRERGERQIGGPCLLRYWDGSRSASVENFRVALV